MIFVAAGAAVPKGAAVVVGAAVVAAVVGSAAGSAVFAFGTAGCGAVAASVSSGTACPTKAIVVSSIDAAARQTRVLITHPFVRGNPSLRCPAARRKSNAGGGPARFAAIFQIAFSGGGAAFQRAQAYG